MKTKSKTNFLRIVSATLCLHFINISVDTNFRFVFNHFSQVVNSPFMGEFDTVAELVYEFGTGEETPEMENDNIPVSESEDEGNVKTSNVQYFSQEKKSARVFEDVFSEKVFPADEFLFSRFVSEIIPPPPRA